MPPSREFKVDLDEHALIEVTTELNLKNPITVHVARHETGQRHGDWVGGTTRTITLYPGIKLLQNSGLRAAHLEITTTLLHELRHAYQDDHWSQERRDLDRKRPYTLREGERDAEDWATKSTHRYRSLVRIRPKPTKGPLGRLVKAEAQARS